MTDAETLELERIREEFNQSNPQVFTVKYFNDARPEVRYLIALAEWRQLKNNSEFPNNLEDIQNFAQRYRVADYAPTRLLAVQAMHAQLKQPHLNLDEFNDLTNTILQYANETSHQDPDVALALCDVYWYKAEQLKDKDFFKARHFYQKMMKETEKINDQRLIAQQLKAMIALMRLQYQQLKDQQRDEQLYIILDRLHEINDKKNPDLCEQAKNLLCFYLEQRVKLSVDDYDVVSLNQLLEYIEEHDFLRYILLETDYILADWQVLTYLAFFHWVLEEEELFETYLQTYFRVENNDEQLLTQLETTYQFENDRQKAQYIELVKKSREKYTYREKYRKMFKTKK